MDARMIEQAIKVISTGGLLLYPSDTIWGIGCDATNETAVQKVYEVKSRDSSKSLISLVSRIEQIEELYQPLSKELLKILDQDNPTTIIYPNVKGLAVSAIADDGSAGIRLVKRGWIKELLDTVSCPLISTSANISGQYFGGSFEDIDEQIKKHVDLVIPKEYEPKAQRSASIILKLNSDGTFTQLR